MSFEGLVVGFLVWTLTVWGVAVWAQGGFGRGGMPPLNDCGPGYLTIDPDATAIKTMQYLVTVRDAFSPTGAIPRFWSHEFVHPTRSCCDRARSDVQTVVGHIETAQVVVVEDCR